MIKQTAATFSHEVTAEEEGKMLHQVLKNRFRFSRRMMSRLRRSGLVTVNGEIIYFTARVSRGDQIFIRLPSEESGHIPPQEIPFAVVYEDEDIIVIDKPPGLVVHPTRGYPDGTLANGLMHYWAQRGESYKVRPVTRLDKDTSGLMAVAKHAYTHAYLAAQMAEKRYRRAYLAVVHGRMAEDQGIIDKEIGINREQQIRWVIEGDGGAPAVTRFEVVERYSRATRVRLELETGRTHQIRIHLSSIGHPIIGDEMYGTKADQHLISRQALHATYLRLFHPRLREWKEWESSLPQDMERLIAQLKKFQ
ncbi:RluA family pseudouridine synthase [Paenactinomyces guangxiensis]|uniref:Pseudouridine synthase n=1 Tax=Paenactinomyces guangxiensis TaxID=1490290 RepID=A0A7W1WS10_9BACL|nr:RluA family pseudouridine synthase [Paenactinomyces guangxiensis]MBA4494801.1 RluA family pseudouridine synthase [Paenactinomyces guangxiensis]MBH8591884.1 RluA family pseudouridine synthase [Paenactinomyces guangxiensis]